MKKLAILVLLMAFTASGYAIPAKRGAVSVQQPDGSYVSIVLHGDEWLHFNTTEDGYTVVKNDKGFYVYAEQQGGQLKATRMVAHNLLQRQADEASFLMGRKKFLRPDMTEDMRLQKELVERQEAQRRAIHLAAAGSRRAAQYDYTKFRGLVILVQFNDKQFSRDDFSAIAADMLNTEGYTGYGSQSYTGSVRDYFFDNSLGKFQPHFDVAGPVTISYSQYAANGTSNARALINAAINAADSQVDFSQYDGDGNGVVDLVYFIFAGNGSNYGDNDSRLFWPHRSVIVSNSNSYVYKDGVRLWDYASSVELSGYTRYPSTVKIDGIGTICHEFSHVLGLPDFYDTDYESNGESNHPGDWSLMAGGSYFNDGRTPVGYSLYERWAVGFCDAAPEVVADGSYTLNPLAQGQQGLRINTPVNGEYFLLENRQKSAFKWDAYLPGSGMLVYRVEGEGNYYWQNNAVNAYKSHNYYELIRANGEHTDSNGDYVAHAGDAFPYNSKTSLTNATSPANLKTFSGKDNALGLRNIRTSGGVITFDAAGYDVTALAITPASASVGVEMGLQLAVEVTPSYAETTLTWQSNDPTVATVDGNGLVKGVKVGNCQVTATSANGVTATCDVEVVELTPYSIAEFKQQEIGSVQRLKLTDAEVLGVYQSTAYVRDATGCIMFDGMNLGLSRGDVVNGTLMAQVNVSNKMSQAVGTDATNASDLTIVSGSEPQPRVLTVDALTEAYYGDYVLIKAAKLKSDKGVWMVDGSDNKVARLYNKLQIANITLKNYDGNYYDIPAIYGTDVLDNAIINELYMTASPTKVSAPTGIETVQGGRSAARGSEAVYNFAGQRVNSGFKGLVIKDGKKVVVK